MTTSLGLVDAFEKAAQIPRGPQPQGDLEDLAVEAGVREYVSRLWAEDWNSAEDSAYDAEAAS